MTHHYITDAVRDISAAASKIESENFSAGLCFVADKLLMADPVEAPVGGEWKGTEDWRNHCSLFKPSRPVAIAFDAVDKTPLDGGILTSVSSSKRIALAWEWDGCTPGGKITRPEQCRVAVGDAVCVLSINYVDDYDMWMPNMAALMIPYDYEPVHAVDTRNGRIMIECGRVVSGAKGLVVPEILMIAPDEFSRVVSDYGADFALATLSSDTMDEMNVFRRYSIHTSNGAV